MIVASYMSNRPTMSETRTYEDFYKFLGEKPHMLGVVARMNTDLTAEFLTRALGNIYYGDDKKANKFQSVDATYFEWQIETNELKHIPFAADVTEDGENGSEITMAFAQNWFQKYDILKIDNSRQQCIVVQRPIRRADNYWEVQVRLIDNTYDTTLDLSACKAGMTAVFQSNAHPELSEEGYVKEQHSTERHRNYMTMFRNDASYSEQYKLLENVFIKIGEGDKKVEKETIYKLDTVEKNLLDNFMLSRAQGLLFNKCNVNPATGKALICDPDTGREIRIGDGLVPQIERFASKYAYNKFTREVMETVIQTMNEKADSPIGNTYTFIVNERLWSDIQRVLATTYSSYHTDGTVLYSKSANGFVSVGAKGFDSYNFGGNSIIFKVDRTLSREFGNHKGYGFCLDMSPDVSTGTPAISQFTLKGSEFVSNSIAGVGGLRGGQSGPVASPVAGSKLVLHGYAGIMVKNP